MNYTKLKVLQEEFPFLDERIFSPVYNWETSNIYIKKMDNYILVHEFIPIVAEGINDESQHFIITAITKDNLITPSFTDSRVIDAVLKLKDGFVGTQYQTASNDMFVSGTVNPEDIEFICIEKYHFWGGYDGEIERNLTIYKCKDFDFQVAIEKELEKEKLLINK